MCDGAVQGIMQKLDALPKRVQNQVKRQAHQVCLPAYLSA